LTTTINASPTNGLVQTADGSGVLKVQSNGKTTNALAWVNFNGTGTVAIRSSYNVSSITDGGTGLYTVNFTTALSDANYAVVSLSNKYDGGNGYVRMAGAPSTTAASIYCLNNVATGYVDPEQVYVVVFGN
jgi:hypothetical protein